MMGCKSKLVKWLEHGTTQFKSCLHCSMCFHADFLTSSKLYLPQLSNRNYVMTSLGRFARPDTSNQRMMLRIISRQFLSDIFYRLFFFLILYLCHTDYNIQYYPVPNFPQLSCGSECSYASDPDQLTKEGPGGTVIWHSIFQIRLLIRIT